MVRECHGDLHLANVLRLVDETTAFVGIEFDPQLRWIDVLDRHIANARSSVVTSSQTGGPGFSPPARRTISRPAPTRMSTATRIAAAR